MVRRNTARIKEGHWRIPLCSGLITLGFGLFFIMIHKPIIRFFSSDEMVLMYASRHVSCHVAFTVVFCYF